MNWNRAIKQIVGLSDITSFQVKKTRRIQWHSRVYIKNLVCIFHVHGGQVFPSISWLKMDSFSLHWRWCRWNPFLVIRAKDERAEMLATRKFRRTFRTWLFSPFAREYRRVTQGGSDCHEDDERGHDADDCRNSSLIQKFAHHFNRAWHRDQKVECLQRGLPRVADENASVHSIIRLFGRSDG